MGRESAKFFDDWSMYEQVLDNDYMFHAAIYRGVERHLAKYFGARPISILDLGCGSARHFSAALDGRSVAAYTGYDLSEAPLTAARRNLEGLGCSVDLRRGDLLQALRNENGAFDLIFCGFSLHHLTAEDKAEFCRLAHRRLAADGMLLVIDPAREEDEPRPVYLDRYCGWIHEDWEAMSPEALDAICEHIRNNDYPETAVDLSAIAAEAGFDRARELESFRWHHTWSFEKARPSGVRIREATIEDAPAVARVHIESWRTTYSGIVPDDYIGKFAHDERERVWRKILDDSARRRFVCVAESEDGTVVGFVSGGAARGEANGFAGELYAIYLLDAHQRRGVGRRLTAALARRLLRAGFPSMLIWVLAANKACNFYAALGGAIVAEKRAEIPGAELTEIAYGWKDIRRLLD
jgi:SAM-dependent methyltransferase